MKVRKYVFSATMLGYCIYGCNKRSVHFNLQLPNFLPTEFVITSDQLSFFLLISVRLRCDGTR